MTYKAPVRDLLFALYEAAGFDRLSKAFPDADAETVNAVLEGAGVFTADIAPAGRGVRTAEATRAVLEQLETDCYVAELRD